MKKVWNFIKKVTVKQLLLYLLGALMFTGLISWLEGFLPNILPITTEPRVILYFTIMEGIVRWIGISEIIVVLWLLVKWIEKIKKGN